MCCHRPPEAAASETVLQGEGGAEDRSAAAAERVPTAHIATVDAAHVKAKVP